VKTAVGRQVVVALGEVAPDLVTGHLPPDAQFVADPGPEDLHDAAGAIARADALVDTAMLDRMPNLRVLARTGVGVERVDVAEATRRGIAVVVTPGAGTNAVAEGAFAMILHLVKRLRATTECVAGGRWSERGGITLGDLDGATIGIVGYGRIGREVAKRAVAFGCKVIGANRSPVADKGDASEIYPLAELDRMLPQCDVVLIAAGLGPETRGLIDARRLALLKPTALLINIGRAAIVDEEALYDALSGGRIGGAALDVWWQHWSPEQPDRRPSRCPFHELPNVLMTPHCSGFTEGTADRRWGDLAANLDRFVRGENLHNLVLRT
jgi:D-3-phosphoglycerate dehydrogenase / 2-oxoglutarate reductase